MLPRVKTVLSVEPYKVMCLWNTGEVREVDFQPYLTESKPQSPTAHLADKQLFSEVKTDRITLSDEVYNGRPAIRGHTNSVGK